MLPYPNVQELFNGDAVALHDLELDIFIAKGHHNTDQLTESLRTDDGVPPLFREGNITPGTVKHAWTLFSWHEPRCDAVGEDSPWCLCGLDEGGSRVYWYPTTADQSTPGAIPVTWFKARRDLPADEIPAA